MPVGFLRDLLLTTKAIGHNDCREPSLAHFGQQLAFAASNRYFVFIALITKGTRHPTATGFEDLVIKPHLFHQRCLLLEPHNCLVVAMTLYDRPPIYAKRPECGHTFLQELSESECVISQMARFRR